MLTTLFTVAVALVASLILTVPVRRLALQVGLVDQPAARKIHLEPIPLLGGLAMYCGVILASVVSLHGKFETQTVAILAGATLLGLVGLLDDRGLLHHQVKLFLAMPAAALILMVSGIHADVFAGLVPKYGPALDVVLTLFWVVGITAAFSILDHMDGLCAGVAAIGAAYFTLFASLTGQTVVRVLAAATLGAAVGFLRWNFKPAKIFMGDSGAMFLGFLMATLGLKIRPINVPHATAWMLPVLILVVPIFDTFLVSQSRLRRGLLPFASPGKDHTAHRLSNLGFGQRGAVILIYGLGCVGGVAALLVSMSQVTISYILAGGVVLLAVIGAAMLEMAPFESQREAGKPS
ncbi:MAG: undecaprenyl/decaprenyl-phosphate alpha-N-acetylglucosaminyl 1-phosphate transferase [Acidobacteriota bacterium]|nr:undecaprenyl/decaprenyl-phosphate alpha-N-acetylglucosaminyl 1-phosphate transferase [Acidobacteriota bacterium]